MKGYCRSSSFMVTLYIFVGQFATDYGIIELSVENGYWACMR